jgi:serine/threonine-protein kinase
MADLGKYRIVRRLATGGMAEVFHAKATGPGGFEKDVCLKRVLPHLAHDPEFVEMFKAEARLAAKVQHANVVQIFDFGEADGTYFLAMEYVEGRDLKAILEAARTAGRPVPAGLAAFVAHEVAKGLAYAHSRRDEGRALGIVHRDVSPHNVLVSRAGEVKIADFGIAKATSRGTATRTGVLKGKLAYMSPEQARGEPVDARSDLFSLGIVLHEMLTGSRLFQADTESETLGRVLNAPIESPAALRPETPALLSEIAMRALARDREARYGTAEEMASEIARFLFTLPPEEATAAALTAFLHVLEEGLAPSEEPGHTALASQGPVSPPARPPRALPAAGPRDPTRLRDDTFALAATAFTPATATQRTVVNRRRRAALAGAAALALGVGGALGGTLWALREEAPLPRSGTARRAEPPAAARSQDPPALPPAPSPTSTSKRVATPTPQPAPQATAQDEPAPSKRAALFSLRVTASPEGAQVRVEGETQWRTPPFTLKRLRRGQRIRLEARAEAHRPTSAALTIRRPRGKKHLRLEPLPGVLVVTAIPWAEVFIDGKLVSDMPQTGVRVSAGEHRVRLRNRERGYDRTFPVTVPPGGTKRIRERVE